MAFNPAFLPVPYGLKLAEWAAIASEQLVEYGIPPGPADESEWKPWAELFVNSGIPGAAIPRPDGFADWQQWASSITGTLI